MSRTKPKMKIKYAYTWNSLLSLWWDIYLEIKRTDKMPNGFYIWISHNFLQIYLSPTQLLIQMQWWSNLLTHLLQVKQWRELLVQITSQDGQRMLGSYFSNSYSKLLLFGFYKTPGLLLAENVKKPRERMKNKVTIKIHYKCGMSKRLLHSYKLHGKILKSKRK